MAISLGFGLKVYYGSAATASGSSWTEVANIRDCTAPTIGETGLAETTVHSSTAFGKTYDPALVEPSEWSFKTLYDSTAFGTLKGFLRQKKGWKVVFSDGSSAATDSIMLTANVTSPMEDVMEVEFKMKVYATCTYSLTS